MIAEDAPSIAEVVTGKIQSKVAEFLGCREKLVQLKGNPLLTISSQAKDLMSRQEQLEGELTLALAKIDQIKKGVWAYTDFIRLGAFAKAMNDHIDSVNSLYDQASGTKVQTPQGMAMSTWLPYAIGGVVLIGGLAVINTVIKK